MALDAGGGASRTPTDEDDVALITSVAGGDRQGLERLYDRFAPLLLAIAMRVLKGSRQEAEDLLHDVFFEIWQHAGDYDRTRGTVRTWMALRMRSRAFDRLKSASRSRTSSIEDGSQVLERHLPASDPAMSPDRSPDRTRVREALTALPPEQRTVIEMQVFDDLSCSEIAEKIGVPIGTVKSRLAAALRKLKAQLLPGGIEVLEGT